MKHIATGIEGFTLRFASEKDVGLILQMIRSLAEYENLLDQVVSTEEVLYESLFVYRGAEVVIGEYNGVPAGFALFFHNFSTFLGRSGLYLEDLFYLPEYRGRGFGKCTLAFLAQLAVERGCPRLEWVCLDWNAPSIGFYRSLGAQPMEDWTIYRLTGDALNKTAALFPRQKD